ncbi:MAG: CerR family C-terminal domain-containing protein, partial [Phycisphaerae bacterium]
SSAVSPPRPDDLRYLSACIMGQILFWKTSQAVISRMYADVVYDPPHIARIADYITDFSYNALLAHQAQHAAPPPLPAIGGQP